MKSRSEFQSFLAQSADGRALEEFGFRIGSVGTHSSRTMMLLDLTAVLNQTIPEASKADYRSSVIEENVLGKPTSSTRRLSLQRLSELYGLDPAIPIFRVLRRLWGSLPEAQPLLALQVALARDPLLRGTAGAVIPLGAGKEFVRSAAEEALREVTEGRLNEKILAKVVRNCASTWAQSGHLQGRTFKRRVRVQAHYTSVTLALAIGYRAGFRGEALFGSPWVRLLDIDPTAARDLAVEAKRAGLIDLRTSGNIVDMRLDLLDPSFNQP